MYGTIRGLHFQRGEHGQAKYIRVLSGRIRDVVVDLRPGSPSLPSTWQWSSRRKISVVSLSRAASPTALPSSARVPSSAINATVLLPRRRGGIRYDDPDLAIDWAYSTAAVLSDKDRALPSFKEYRPCC